MQYIYNLFSNLFSKTEQALNYDYVFYSGDKNACPIKCKESKHTQTLYYCDNLKHPYQYLRAQITENVELLAIGHRNKCTDLIDLLEKTKYFENNNSKQIYVLIHKDEILLTINNNKKSVKECDIDIIYIVC